MKILGIESSCDDTSVTLLEADNEGFLPIKEKTASQIEVHKKYGGVVPEIAGRKHAEKIVPTIEEVMKNNPKPDVIAVTCGPGLMTGLMVGVETAKTLSYLWEVPIVAVNHLEGHIYSPKIKQINKKTDLEFEFPVLNMIVSGGHTEIVLMKDFGKYEIIGSTRDDAAGEAFDKIAKLLGLDYPGGAKIEKLAKDGDSEAIEFPRPMIKEDNLDFSFSGLKTAVLYWLKKNELKEVSLEDICASFQAAVVETLSAKIKKAYKQTNPEMVVITGGVSANSQLRQKIQQVLNTNKIYYPLKKYCMDNATMIAIAGYRRAKNKDFISWKNIEANPNLSL